MPETADIDLGPEAASFPPVPPMTAPVPSTPAPIPPAAPMPQPPKTLRGSTPAETFDDPRYQQRIEKEQMGIYQRAQNVAQAEKDVSSARRMLGILKADREIKSGVPMEKAMWQNMQYFVQPGDKTFAGTFKALQPPKPTTVQNFPGIPAPAVVDPRGVPHFVPRNAMPQPEFKASVEEIAPGVKAAKLGPNHYQLLDRPQIKGTLDAVTKVQIDLWKNHVATLRKVGGDEKEIAALEDKIMEAAKGAGKAQADSGRVRVKSADGKTGSIPRSQLEEARKAGYSVMDASD